MSNEQQVASTSDMDALCDSVSASMTVHVGGSDAAALTGQRHPRFANQYKNRDTRSVEEVQERRRRDALERQNKSRFDAQMRARALALNEDLDSFMESLDDENTEDVDMATTNTEETKQTKKREGGKKESYANQLMISEWLVHIPDVTDFASDWLMRPCPVGKRCLLVAANGRTLIYSKVGRLWFECVSALPGGSARAKSAGDYTLLDVVYSGERECFYVLDLICWRQQSMYECESEFRFYWLATQFEERADALHKITKNNRYPLYALPHCACEVSAMQTMMNELESAEYTLDGLLFYHRRAHYTPGVSSLVGWLKPFMLPTILNVPIADKFKNETESAHEFINAFEQTPARMRELRMLAKQKDKQADVAVP